jgi:arylformamidase
VTRFVELGHALEDGLSAPARVSTRVAGDLSLYPNDPLQRGGTADRSGIRLAAVAGLPGLIVDAPVPPRTIALRLAETAVQDRAILIRTGWDKRWGTEGYREAGPDLGPETIGILARGGAALVGVDFCAIDARHGPSGVARLLRAGVLVIENLRNLSAVPADSFRFFAVPIAIVGGVRVPVRAFAELLPR